MLVVAKEIKQALGITDPVLPSSLARANEMMDLPSSTSGGVAIPLPEQVDRLAAKLGIPPEHTPIGRKPQAASAAGSIAAHAAASSSRRKVPKPPPRTSARKSTGPSSSNAGKISTDVQGSSKQRLLALLSATGWTTAGIERLEGKFQAAEVTFELLCETLKVAGTAAVEAVLKEVGVPHPQPSAAIIDRMAASDGACSKPPTTAGLDLDEADSRPPASDPHGAVATTTAPSGGEVSQPEDGCPRDPAAYASGRCSLNGRAGIRCCSDHNASCISVCWASCKLHSMARWARANEARRHYQQPPLNWLTDGTEASLDEASAECEARGMRLCARSELGRCCGSYCQGDNNARVWTSECVRSLARDPAFVTCNKAMSQVYAAHSTGRPGTPAGLDRTAPVLSSDGSTCAKRWCGLGPRAQPFVSSSPPRRSESDSEGGASAVKPLPCGVIWFVHVPKAGGTTVREFFQHAEHVTRWKYIDFCGSNAKPQWNASLSFRRINHWVDLVRPTYKPRLTVHHHNGVPGVLEPSVFRYLKSLRERLQRRGCTLLVMTMLREPVAREISNVMFSRVAPPRLCEHAQALSDAQFRYLSATWGAPGAPDGPDGFHCEDGKASRTLSQRLALLPAMLDAPSAKNPAAPVLTDIMDVVVTTDMLPRFLSVLRALMGCSTHCTGSGALDVEGHSNPTENCSQYQPTPEQVHFVRTQNSVDARLYDAWCAESCARPAHPSLVGWRELPVL